MRGDGYVYDLHGRWFYEYMKVKRKVLVAQSYATLCDPMDCSLPGIPLSLEFSRQEYWSGLAFPFPGDLPNPGTKYGSSALQILYHLSQQESPRECILIPKLTELYILTMYHVFTCQFSSVQSSHSVMSDSL